MIMIKPKTQIDVTQVKREIRTWYAFEKPLGEVVHNKRFFFAWKDGCLMGTYSTLGEAMESLEGGRKAEDAMNLRTGRRDASTDGEAAGRARCSFDSGKA